MMTFQNGDDYAERGRERGSDCVIPSEHYSFELKTEDRNANINNVRKDEEESEEDGGELKKANQIMFKVYYFYTWILSYRSLFHFFSLRFGIFFFTLI